MGISAVKTVQMKAFTILEGQDLHLWETQRSLAGSKRSAVHSRVALRTGQSSLTLVILSCNQPQNSSSQRSTLERTTSEAALVQAQAHNTAPHSTQTDQ